MSQSEKAPGSAAAPSNADIQQALIKFEKSKTQWKSSNTAIFA
jgi:hypothetical protein